MEKSIVRDPSFHHLIESLSKIIELKDMYTAGHSDRVAVMSQKIAEYMSYDRAFCDYIHLTGHLHDIGKVGIPDGILLKTGRLSPEEFNVMKNHSVIGYDILKDTDGFRIMARIIRGHHERYDGRGYPDGLKKDEIHIGSSIIAVADSFDAMTTARPYKKSFTIDHAVNELVVNIEKQFHPDAVAAFLQLLDREHAFIERIIYSPEHLTPRIQEVLI